MSPTQDNEKKPLSRAEMQAFLDKVMTPEAMIDRSWSTSGDGAMEEMADSAYRAIQSEAGEGEILYKNQQKTLDKMKSKFMSSYDGTLDSEVSDISKDLQHGVQHGAVTGLFNGGNIVESVFASISSMATSLIMKLEPVRKFMGQASGFAFSQFSEDKMTWEEAGEVAEKDMHSGVASGSVSQVPGVTLSKQGAHSLISMNAEQRVDIEQTLGVSLSGLASKNAQSNQHQGQQPPQPGQTQNPPAGQQVANPAAPNQPNNGIILQAVATYQPGRSWEGLAKSVDVDHDNVMSIVELKALDTNKDGKLSEGDFTKPDMKEQFKNMIASYQDANPNHNVVEGEELNLNKLSNLSPSGVPIDTVKAQSTGQTSP